MSGRAETGVRISVIVCVCVCVCVWLCVCVCVYCSIADNGELNYNIKKMLAEMCVNVVFVIRCLYSAVSLTLVK